MIKGYFITGIGTGVGKTFVSALLCKANQWDYWKPIQCGSLENTDSDFVRSIADQSKIHPEKYLLKEAASPHQAAHHENVSISIHDFKLPDSNVPILVEGAGGLMVPLNYNGETMLDLIKHFNLPVIVVVNFYLGSINHTLLSLNQMKSAGIPIYCIVYNGSINLESKMIISKLFPRHSELIIPEMTNPSNFNQINFKDLLIN